METDKRHSHAVISMVTKPQPIVRNRKVNSGFSQVVKMMFLNDACYIMDNETDKMFRRNKEGYCEMCITLPTTSYSMSYYGLWVGILLLRVSICSSSEKIYSSYYNQSQIRQMIREVYVKYIPLGSSH